MAYVHAPLSVDARFAPLRQLVGIVAARLAVAGARAPHARDENDLLVEIRSSFGLGG